MSVYYLCIGGDEMFQKIPKIPEYLQDYFNEEPQFHYYDEYKKHVSQFRKIDERFVCLKGFSSSTPIVNSVAFDEGSSGGGFYFRINNVGVVVDPGIGFVSLMHKYNIFIDDIDIVIVTHDHIDHNCDVNVISSLLYDYNRNQSKELFLSSLLVEPYVEKMHHIEWYLDNSTIIKTKNILENKYVHSLKDLVGNSTSIFNSDSSKILLESFITKHIRDSDDSYAIKLTFTDGIHIMKWGYTSDTAYFPELGSFLNDCDSLLLNISDIYVKDVRGDKPKKSHLGFNGCVELLTNTHPQVALVSEFCCTNGDYRHEIVRALRERIETENTIILPADVGCKVSVNISTIECSLCKRDTDIHNIRILHPLNEFNKMQYICPHCLL